MIAFSSGMVVNAQTPNILADPTVHGIYSAKDFIPVGDTSLITLDIANEGSHPVPAGGAEWIVVFPKNVWPDQTSVDYGYTDPNQTPIFTSSFTLTPDSSTVWKIEVVGSGIAALVFLGTDQTNFPVTVSVEGLTQGGPVDMTLDCTNNPVVSGDLQTGNNHADREIVVTPGIGGLDLDFISIDAEWYEEFDARVLWTVANEVGNDYFRIQRSTNSRDFEYIGEVKSIGDHQEEYTYHFIDEGARELEESDLYYRVVQVDLDGSMSATSIVHLSKEGSSLDIDYAYEIFPNPATGDNINLTIQSPENLEEKQVIRVINMNGQILAEKAVKVLNGRNTYSFDISGLPAGAYNLVLNNKDNGETDALRFIKM